MNPEQIIKKILGTKEDSITKKKILSDDWIAYGIAEPSEKQGWYWVTYVETDKYGNRRNYKSFSSTKEKDTFNPFKKSEALKLISSITK